MSRKPQPILLTLSEADADALERVLLDWLSEGFVGNGTDRQSHVRQLVRKLHEARSPVVRA